MIPTIKPEEIAEAIRLNKWSSTENMDIDNFVYEVTPNEYAPIMDAIIQSRPETYNPDFVKRQVRKSKAGINVSSPATVVYFPDEAIVNGDEIDSNSYRLIDRTHGMVINKYLGKSKLNAYVVNYKHDLESNELSIYRLANLLNRVDNEVQPLSDEAIKLELYRLMDKRIAKGKDGKPSNEERKSFLKAYPQIDDRVYTNWVSNHTSGGRRDPIIKYSLAELQAFHGQLKNMNCYDGWVIISPTTTASWSGEALGRAIMQCTDKEKKKLLIPLYASNVAQAKLLKKKPDGSISDFEKKIKDKFFKIKEFWGFEELEYILMKFDK